MKWTNPDGSQIYIPDSVSGAPKPVRQFLREAGQRGGRQRSRNFARRSVRGYMRFWRLYKCDPKGVRATPVKANPEVWSWLKEFASRGGQARARRYPKEVLRAWSAKGGHAKAAKTKQASSRT